MAQETNSKTSRLGIVKTNAKTGVVSLVYNVNDTNSFKGNAEEMAFRFITSHSKEFLKGESAGSKHLKTIKSPAGNHVGYIQTVAGVPVIGAITAVNINKENKVTFVANHYQPGIKVSTQPKISAVQAIGIARQSFTNTGFKTVIENKTELSVFVTDNQVPLLVWKVNMLPDFGGDWYFLIDALTGEIVKKENIEMNVNGTGKVFDPDPGSYFQDATLPDNNDANYFADQNVYKTRTLPGLNSPVSGYYYLRGQYAYCLDIGEPYDAVVSNTSSTFNYTHNQNGFEETNCYYHLDNSIRYVRSLGFAPEWNNQTATVTDIVFDARGETGINAHYYPGADYITYGVLTNNVDAGEDQSVIVHELGHAFHDALIIGGISVGGSDRAGISEGIADYLGIDYRRQLSWYRPNARVNWFYPSAPNTIESSSDANFQNLWSGHGAYDQMRTLASSLMDLEYNNALDPSQGYQLGRTVVTILQLASLSYITAYNDRYENVLAMYQADIDCYNGAHLRDLIEVYHNRQLFIGTDNQVESANIAANNIWNGYKMVEGNITVTTGKTLTLAPSSILVLNGNLTIAPGATLVVGENTSIYSFGFSIINNGTITISNGANIPANQHLVISGSGYTALNSNISAGIGSSVQFTGTASTTKMIEVQSAVNFSSNLSSVSFSTGKIVMNNTSSRLRFDGPTSSVSFDNVKVTSASGAFQSNPGVTLYNIQHVSAQNSTFEYSQYGLYLMTTSSYNRPIINNCTFSYCTYGLLAYNSGINISNSSFHHNSNMGIYCL